MNNYSILNLNILFQIICLVPVVLFMLCVFCSLVMFFIHASIQTLFSILSESQTGETGVGQLKG